MAWHGLVLGAGQRRLDLRAWACASSYAAGHLGAALARPCRRVRLDDPEGVEARRQRRAESWIARSERATSVSVAGSRRSSALIPALDEHGDEALRVVEHRGDRGRDPDRGRALVRDPLRAAVDLEQAGVLARHPDHVVDAAETGAEVAVRDPALQRLGLSLRFAQERRQLLDDSAQFVLGGLTSRPVDGNRLASSIGRPATPFIACGRHSRRRETWLNRVEPRPATSSD